MLDDAELEIGVGRSDMSPLEPGQAPGERVAVLLIDGETGYDEVLILQPSGLARFVHVEEAHVRRPGERAGKQKQPGNRLRKSPDRFDPLA